MKFLADNHRFKLSFDSKGRVGCFCHFAKELDQRWVALVPAEDDRHMLDATSVEDMQAMYSAQSACTDEWADKYRAEVERKADATLLARIAELEASLAVVNARLAQAQATLAAAK